MNDEIETIQRNPESVAAWKRECAFLREQVENLTKERDALAEQNEKMREALTDALYWLPEKIHRGGVENGYWEPSGDAVLRSRAVVVKALSLSNLATPALNRIKGNK